MGGAARAGAEGRGRRRREEREGGGKVQDAKLRATPRGVSTQAPGMNMAVAVTEGLAGAAQLLRYPHSPKPTKSIQSSDFVICGLGHGRGCQSAACILSFA